MTHAYPDADPLVVSAEEAARAVPAARCRDCGVVTWNVSIRTGTWRVRAKHANGCSRPPSRLDLLAKIPFAQRTVIMDGRLLRPMTTAEVRKAAEELGWEPR